MSIYDYLVKWGEHEREEGEWDVAELALSQARHVARPVIQNLTDDPTAKLYVFLNRTANAALTPPKRKPSQP